MSDENDYSSELFTDEQNQFLRAQYQCRGNILIAVKTRPSYESKCIRRKWAEN
jgi:hypothetical protein